jgi:hypothetical protein
VCLLLGGTWGLGGGENFLEVFEEGLGCGEGCAEGHCVERVMNGLGVLSMI